MKRIVVIADELEWHDAAWQLSLVLPQLTTSCSWRIITVGSSLSGGFGQRVSGVAVESCPIRGPWDFRAIRHLRQACQLADRVLVFGTLATRLSLLLPHKGLIASGTSRKRVGYSWLNRLALRRAHRVLAWSECATSHYQRLGLPPDRMIRMPLSLVHDSLSDDLSTGSDEDKAGSHFRRSLGIPAEARLILAAGPLTPSGGLRDAIWAFDALKYDSRDWHMLVLGDGPARASFESFGRAIAYDDYRIHFLGWQAEALSWLGVVEAVWLPGFEGGLTLALHALAAGRVVLTWAGTEVAELIDAAHGGGVVPPRNRIALASRTLAILNDPNSTERFRQVGRAWAHRFSLARAVQAWKSILFDDGSAMEHSP